MREIKFRGVHPEVRLVMDVCVIDWMHDEVFFAPGSDVGYRIDECKLMQFTGLCDKNGVDIYECDIVEHPSFDCLLSVVYIEQETRWFALDQCDYLHELSDITDASKVIGNIHENPELLND